MTSDNPRLVIGLVGRKGSGKGTVARLLKDRYGASVYRFSDLLRDVLDLLDIEKSRENLIQLSEIVRRGFGEDALKRGLLKRMGNDSSPLIVLDGIRRLGDLNGLEDLGNFHLVSVTAPLETRYERITRRGENAGEMTRTLDSFKTMETAPTEVTIGDVETNASNVIDNSGDPEALERQVDALMRVLKP